MRARRLAAVLAGAGALVSCPVAAQARPAPEPPLPVASASSSAALRVLTLAATTSRDQVWAGTQRVLSVVDGTPVVTSAPVAHPAGTDVEEADLLRLLAAHYELTLREEPTARVVEVRRPGLAGPAAVAGRYWVDRRTGLVVRRDVLDARGALLRRTELLGVRLRPLVLATSGVASWPAGEHLDAADLADFRARGWLIPTTLVGAFDLYEARWLDAGVLQLSYSDGLTTLSLFAQRGEARPQQSGVVRRMAGGDVWVSAGEPERMVWAAAGCTWTLVSDADPAVLDAVVAALPHRARHATQEGMLPRVWRGMSRVGSWLNPFD